VEFGKDMPATEFVGYDHDTVNGAKVLGIVAEGELVDEIVSGMEAILVLDKTPFYAEMGGQVADHGVITGDGMEFVVSDVQKNKGGKFMHYGKLLSGSVAVSDSVTASIDTDRRAAIRRAHSATHLLDAALVKVLGDHVHQAGSLVEPDRLRFDFTHFEGITPQQLDEVEDLVNDAILSGLPITTEELPIAEAKARGAVATFGEKYGQTVRVVTMGDFSMELCGGGVKRGVPSGTRLIADSNDPVETPVRSGYPTSIAGATASIVSQVVADYPVEVDRLTQDEKMEIMDILNRKGVFLLKGSVSHVAQALHSSEASIYRYLGKLNNK